MIFNLIVASTVFVIVFVAIVARLAFGAGVSIPERFSDICNLVGHPNCLKLIDAPGGGTATFVVSLNDSVNYGGHTAVVTARIRHGYYPSQTYYNATQAPCFFHSCSVGSYAGPSETDISDNVELALAKLPYQIAEGELSAQLHEAFGVSVGVPYIAKVYERTARVWDGSGSTMDTTLAVKVKIRFAIGAK
jgi:hypothetical protein